AVVLLRLALSDAREPRHRARPERRRLPHQLRRDPDRQGPRRLLPRRAAAGPPPARLPGGPGPGAGPDLSAIREDFREILTLVRPGARVLDIGCGEGEVLELLTPEKDAGG